jgi:hypothetical protein
VGAIADAQFLRGLLRVADRRVPRWSRQIRDVIRRIRNLVKRDDLRRSAATGNLEQIFGALHDVELDQRLGRVMSKNLRDTIRAGGLASLRRLSEDLGLALDWEAIAPRAANWARARAAKLVQRSQETRVLVVRGIVTAALEEGLDLDVLEARLFASIGLTTQEEGALAAFAAKLAETGGATAAEQRQLVEVYRKRLLRHRSRRIARTESVNAVNGGQQTVWSVAVQRRLIDPDVWAREWVAILGDGRTCIRCLTMHGRRAAIRGFYETPEGTPIAGPTLHVFCRCGQRLVRWASRAPKSPPLVEPEAGGTLQPMVPAA